jgi:hypothetical protein
VFTFVSRSDGAPKPVHNQRCETDTGITCALAQPFPTAPGSQSSREHQIIQAIIQRRIGRRTPVISAALCKLVHNYLRSSGTEYGSRRAQAMTQRPAKRIPQWLRIDLLVIVVSLAIIGIYLYGLAIID